MKTGGARARGVSRYWLNNVAARIFHFHGNQGPFRYHPECAEGLYVPSGKEPVLDEAREADGRLCNRCYLPIDYANPQPTLYHLDGSAA